MMIVLSSQVFDFLDQHSSYTHDRFEFAEDAFAKFRRSARTLAVRLRDRDDFGVQLSTRIGAMLCEVLTVPMSFEPLEDSLQQIVGAGEIFRRSFGTELADIYRQALDEAQDLRKSINPLRRAVAGTVAELRATERNFKIFCHRRARLHFEVAVHEQNGGHLSDSEFLHSVRDYRNSYPFHTTLKVGPLRSFGWGAAPDALVTAPRFEALIQFVWSGCDDEPGFGYDPVDVARKEHPTRAGAEPEPKKPKQWTLKITKVGAENPISGGADDSYDEFKLLDTPNAPPDARAATLVQISESQGILIPRFARVMSFDPQPASLEPIDRRIPAESLEEGMYLIRANIEDLDLGSVKADHGQFSLLWKEALRTAWDKEPNELLVKLRSEGLSLSGLAGAIDHWCRPPSTVIHAPRELRHFEILLHVLNLMGATWPDAIAARVPFWRLAWNEIRSSRGEAIQAGFLEHELVEEELLVILRGQIGRVRENLGKDFFSIGLAPDQGISGSLDFNRVHRIEEGFFAPESSLKYVAPIGDFDQWRA